MGIKQLKKLTKEYREAVLAGRSDVADVAARLKVEAGNTFPQIAAEVANEKAAQDAQAPADGKGLGDEPVIAPVSTLRKVVPASPLVPPPEKNPVRPHVGQAKDPNANAKSQAARRLLPCRRDGKGAGVEQGGLRAGHGGRTVVSGPAA